LEVKITGRNFSPKEVQKPSNGMVAVVKPISILSWIMTCCMKGVRLA